MNPTSSSPGMTNLLSPGSTAPAPTQTMGQDDVISVNHGQLSEFSELISTEVIRRNGLDPTGKLGQQGSEIAENPVQGGLLEGFLINGKEMPETADFAAESSAELDETEAGLLFSMLGLSSAKDARPPGSSENSRVPGPSAFSAAINSSVRGSAMGGGTASPQKTLPPQTAGGTEPRAPFLDILGYGADPDTGTPLQPFSAGARDALARETVAQQPLPIAAAPARGAEPPSASPDTFNLLTGMQPAAMTSRLAPAAAVALDIPMGEPSWSKGLGERILWMVGQSVQAASIQINPRHLGPVDIQLNLQQDQASVTFSSPHAVVREVLEAAIPRLREMFNDSNLQLVNVDVGQRDNQDGGALARQFRDQSMPQGGSHGTAAGGDHSATDEEHPASRSGFLASKGLLDDYA